eukprot:TRINITY_DN4445_c0_g1_i1.p1 TRINITY_DN4445_c0_g1~~TRINITY_DN4445_c0_g1_i1.p1  ORF type:complete len:552 (+),score=116.89 TRINITY_DN4445_c0_g1_i1:668-2323(+)
MTDKDTKDEAELLRMLEQANETLESNQKAVVFDDGSTDSPKGSRRQSRVATPQPSPFRRSDQPAQRRRSHRRTASNASRSSTRSNDSESIASQNSNQIPWDEFSSEKAIIDAWADVIGNYDTWAKKKSKQLTALVYQGIPDDFRCLAWQLFAKARSEQSIKTLYDSASGGVPPLDKQEANYAHLVALPSDQEKRIRLDIKRTFPEHELFQSSGESPDSGQQVLLNVVKAYANYDGLVQYCQGMPFIVGMLLMHMPEEDAFQLLVVLMQAYELRDVFKPTMAALPVRLYQFERLIASAYPKLDQHFNDLGINANMFATQWFLTLFSSTLPLPAAFRIFDLFLYEGQHALFKVGLAIIGQCQAELLRSGFEDVMALLSRASLCQRYQEDVDGLMTAVRHVNLPFPNKRLQRWEKDYHAKLKLELEQSSELVKVKLQADQLQEENTELRQKLMEMEASYKALAEKNLVINEQLADRTDALEDATSEIASLKSTVTTPRSADVTMAAMQLEDDENRTNTANGNDQSCKDRSSKGDAANVCINGNSSDTDRAPEKE